MLAQQHRPGEAAQTDFTWVNELAVTILGQAFVHMLCVFTLPYSNWRWATVCLSESIAAIRKGVQRALFQLGRVPAYHQTDNSTAATHRIPDGKTVTVTNGKRPFNADYQEGSSDDNYRADDNYEREAVKRGGRWGDLVVVDG